MHFNLIYIYCIYLYYYSFFIYIFIFLAEMINWLCIYVNGHKMLQFPVKQHFCGLLKHHFQLSKNHVNEQLCILLWFGMATESRKNKYPTKVNEFTLLSMLFLWSSLQFMFLPCLYEILHFIMSCCDKACRQLVSRQCGCSNRH